MKIEDQVCSLELAKRLKELGLKQESHFWWHEIMHPVDNHFYEVLSDTTEFETDPAFECIYSAFTVAELGEMLPNTEDCISRREPNQQEWRCGNQIEGTEADARAKILIYLIENKLITL